MIRRSHHGRAGSCFFALVSMLCQADPGVPVIDEPLHVVDTMDAICGASGEVSRRGLLQVVQHRKSTQAVLERAEVVQHRKSTQAVLERANATLKLAGTKENGGGGQQSIFALEISKIDSSNFWLVIAAMLLMTVVVDRGQAYLEHLADGHARRQAVLARMNAELVMFGIVAIALFVLTNLANVETTFFLQIEYVDILCSLACLALMSIIGGFFAIYTPTHGRTLKAYEGCELKEGEVPTGTVMDAATYQTLARRFQEEHELPAGFVFFVYLDECMVRDCCAVMNVRWYVWTLLMFLCSGVFLWKRSSMHTASVQQYLFYMVAFHVALFLIQALVACWISHPYAELIKSAPEMASAGSASAESIKVKSIRPHNYSLKFLLQFLALVNALFVVHFLMHEIHVIFKSGVSYFWALSLVPLVLNFFPLLPLSLTRMSFVDAYYATNPEALDIVLSELQRLNGDKHYVRMLWEEKGRPPPNIQGQVDLLQFRDVILKEQLGLWVSDMRAKRLFHAFDLDGSGSVSVEEFIGIMTGDLSDETLTTKQKMCQLSGAQLNR